MMPNGTKNKPTPKLYLLEEVLFEKEEEEGKEEGFLEVVEEVVTLPFVDNPEISLHALTGSQNSKTMRWMGRIGAQWVTILIDTGSSHNFLDPAVLKKTKLPLNMEEKVKLRVANGEVIPSEGRCSGVKVKIQDTLFFLEAHVLVLAECNTVLRIQWFQEIGSILWDFQKLTMSFSVGEKMVKLKGLIATKLIEEGSLNKFNKLEKKGVVLQMLHGMMKVGEEEVPDSV